MSIQADIGGMLKRNSDPAANEIFGHWAFDDYQMVSLIRDVVLECSRVAKMQSGDNKVCDAIERHFGIES